MSILRKELNARTAMLALVSMAVVGAGIYGGGLLYRRISAAPKSPEQVRKEVYSYLRSKGRVREFTATQPATNGQDAVRLTNALAALRVELQNVDANVARLQQELRVARSGSMNPASSTNAPALSGNSTNTAPAVAAARQSRVAALSKELQTLREQENEKQRELRKKQKELNRLADEAGTAHGRLGKDLRRQVKDAATWEMLYAAMGNELFTAEQWMAGTEPESRRAGVELAEEARQQAANDASSEWLAARVVEGFILPNLELADAGHQGTGNADRLLTSASMTFRNADETNNLIRAGEMLIARSANPVRADYARSQLAYVFEQNGEFGRALELLRAVKSSNVLAQIQRRIPRLEQRVKSAK